MAPRHNPRRSAGAPVRFEDDETYLIERPRDPTKPTWPKLLAQSTDPYDRTLSPVSWNTRSLDQPFDQTPAGLPIQPQEVATNDTRKEEDFNTQLSFENPTDFDMATSEFEGEDSEDNNGQRNQTAITLRPSWSGLEPALQLSMYEYVYRFLEGQKEKHPIGVQKNDIVRAKAAAMLGLSSHELSDIERQRAFRAVNPISEEYLQQQWWKDEEATIRGEDPLSKEASQYRNRWHAINTKYLSLMAHICKYTYTKERAIKLARVYLEARGLKSKVIGEWIEGEEEATMILVSTQAADLKSPLLLPVSGCTVLSQDIEPLPEPAVSALAAASQPPQEATVEFRQAQPSLQPHLLSPEIRSVEDFARRHDPKPVRPVFAQGHVRGRSLVRASDIHMKVNSNGRAEIRKKRSKRPADSELRPGYHREYVGGQMIVVLPNGSVGLDVDTEPTAEVESLLLAGFEASRRGNPTSLTSRMQDSAIPRSPYSAPRSLPRRFSDVLLEIDSNHMSTVASSGSATGDQGIKSYSITSTPPQPEWSPIESSNRPASPSPSPSPVKSTITAARERVAKSSSVAPASTPLREVEIQRKLQSPRAQDKREPPKQFSFQTIARDIATSQENRASDANNRYERSSSVPLLAPYYFNDDHDIGKATNRATSNEPDITNPAIRLPSKTPKRAQMPKPSKTLKTPTKPKDVKTPKAKKPLKPSSQKVKDVQSTRKGGNGSRGGPGSYTKKQKTTNVLKRAAAPLVEKTNVGASGGTSHAA